METGKYINSNRSKKIYSAFKGDRNFKETDILAEVDNGKTFSIQFPEDDNLLLVPESLYLSFDFVIEGDDSAYPLNNLSSNLIEKVVIKIGSEEIFVLDDANLFLVYKDLWLSKEKRLNSVERGIQDEELSKMRSVKSYKPENPKKSYIALKKLYGNRYKLPLNFDAFADHIPLPTKEIKSKITIHLTLNKAKNVLKTTKPEEVKFKLQNIKIHFETISQKKLYDDILNKITYGYSFYYDHVFRFDKNEIDRSSTLINKEFIINRMSLKGILIIFQNGECNDGSRDSEFFLNPEINAVKISISGISNKVYSEKFYTIYHWNEISKYFITEENKENHSTFMNIEKYYGENKYALWIDFRTTEDNLFGSGIRLPETSIKVDIHRNSTGDGKFYLYSYLVSDARVQIKNKIFSTHELITKSD